jgi:DNA polymerase-3 subunit epsilon
MTNVFAALARQLQITRPLVCVDLETTGKVPGVDRVIQIGVMRAQPNGDVREWSTFVDPQIDIPAEATLAHKITNEMVAGAPTFADLGPILMTGLSDCDFVGQHVKFDLRFLEAEFNRAGLPWSYSAAAIIDTLRIDQVKDPRTLEALLKKYCGEDHPEAHEALADVRATVNVLAGEFRAYPDLPQTVADLHALLWPRDPSWVDAAGKIVWRNHEACLGFGKNNGRSLREVASRDRGFLEWMLRNDFPADVKQIVRNALDNKFPVHIPQQEAA